MENTHSDKDKDASLPGREEEVVNQQEEKKVTNAEESNESTNMDTVPKMSNGGNKRFDDSYDKNAGEQSYSEGLFNNSDNQDTPPEIGKDDAEKTQKRNSKNVK